MSKHTTDPLNVPASEPASEKKSRKKYVPEDPSWVLTETVNGTPIAIVGICGDKGNCFLMVRPHYKEKSYKTIIQSASVMRPDFESAEVEQEFNGICWAVAPTPKVPDTQNVTVVLPQVDDIKEETV